MSVRVRAAPAVSVLIPVFNGGSYLALAVTSILDQTLREIEVLALDDGSTDDSLATLQRLARGDSRLRVVSRENRGLVSTLNELLHLAKAPLIARMDADDVSLPTRLQRQLSYLEKHPACVAIGSRVRFIESAGLPIFDDDALETHEQIDARHWSAEMGLCHPSVMMRKGAVLSVGGYDERYRHAEDLDLFLRMAEVGRLANLKEIVFEYRFHQTSISHEHIAVQREAARRAIEAAAARRGHEAPVLRDLERPSVEEMNRRWAWTALSARNVVTARRQAWLALRRSPLAPENWRVMLCALRGR